MVRVVPNADSAGSASVHDAVLAAIPASVLLVAVVAMAASLSPRTGLALGSLPATGVVGYALFYRPPPTESER